MPTKEHLQVYVVINESRYGPFSVVELRALFLRQQIDADSLVWLSGMEDWTTLGQIDSLFEHCKSVGEPVGKEKSGNRTQPAESKTKKSDWYFIAHWKGNLTPARSFWINTALPILILGLLAASFDHLAGIVGSWYSVGGVWFLYVSAFTLFGCLFVWQNVGLWRVSNAKNISPNLSASIRAFVVFYLIAVVPSFAYLTSNLSGLDNKGFEPRHFFITTNEEIISIQGILEYGVSDAFLQHLALDPSIRVVALDSEGGLTTEAIKLSAKIEEDGLDTVIVGQCLSACTRVFAAGRERTILHNSNIGFHSTKSLFAIEEFDELQTQEFYAPLVEKGFPREMLQNVLTTPSDQMWYAPTIPLHESGFITRISPNLAELADSSVASTALDQEPERKTEFIGPNVFSYDRDQKDLQFPVPSEFLGFSDGDYVFNLFNTMTYAENELVLVLVREEDHYNADFEDDGYKLYARVEILVPQMEVDQAQFKELKNYFATNYQQMLLEMKDKFQKELDKGSQRFSQTTETDVRFTGTEIRPVRLVEDNEDFMIYEIELDSQVQIDGNTQLIQQSGLQTLVRLNKSAVMVNWYCDKNLSGLVVDMKSHARDFVNSAILLNE